MEQNNLVNILLPLSLPKAFTYSAPKDMEIKAGDFVEVPLGSKQITGVVWGKTDKQIEKIKEITKRLDTPPVNKNLRKFIDWVAEYTISPPGAVLKMAISIPEAFQPEKLIEVYKTANRENIRTTPSREKVLELLQNNNCLTSKEIQEQAEVSASIIKGLLDSGAIEKIYVKPKQIIPIISKLNINFSEQQKEAVNCLYAKIANRKYSTTVLDGVTGSGKTEVYFAAIEKIFEQGGSQALIMLPEIALTTQIVFRFEEKFGFRPTIWHSNLTKKQREKNWRDISEGRARLVIGARSALFLPYKNLKLIVVDEEHDGSYKQEEGVIYHARDMAVVRATIEQIPIILASATPSIETLENIKAEKYTCVHLPSRHGGAVMPEIKIVDMRKERQKYGFWLSAALKTSLAHNLEAGKQSMLFLNRRGYAPLLLCRECGYRFKCPDCSSWLVEHKSPKKLLCHHCGYARRVPNKCPECEKEDMLISCGPGVERIAEEVANTFPEARISLMTSDKMTSIDKAADMVNDITSGNVDIIIGTQIISKGYHFPELTLVGIIDADLGLEGGDLRASERTYQLLQQVSGRAGREKEKGRVLIQSYMPTNLAIKSIASGDRDAFMSYESQSRKKTKMPPYARLAGVIISGGNEKKVIGVSKAIAASAPVEDNIRLLGPVPAPLYLLRGKYRYRILVRADRNMNIQKWLNALLSNIKIPSDVRVKVDVDPYSFM